MEISGLENEQSDSISEYVEEALASLLPETSREVYEKEYQKFKDWMKAKSQTAVCERVLLAYLKEKGEIYKASTLWCVYSKIKATLMLYDQIDIGKYNLVKAFMKRKNVGYEPKKAKVLDREHIVKFITEAPDHQFLAIKVILAFGVAGACRSDELYKMTIDDIQDTKKCLVITIPHTKTNKKRVFIVLPEPPINGVELYRNYITMQPKKVANKWLFLSFRNGKCTVQRIGINTFYGVPRLIARYLKLDKPEEYTGHSLRRSSATLLVDAGGDLLTLKRHGGWRGDNIAMGYVEDSIEQKVKIAKKILQGDQPSTSTTTDSELTENNVVFSKEDNVKNSETNIQISESVSMKTTIKDDHPSTSTTTDGELTENNVVSSKEDNINDSETNIQISESVSMKTAIKTADADNGNSIFNCSNCTFNVYLQNVKN